MLIKICVADGVFSVSLISSCDGFRGCLKSKTDYKSRRKVLASETVSNSARPMFRERTSVHIVQADGDGLAFRREFMYGDAQRREIARRGVFPC